MLNGAKHPLKNKSVIRQRRQLGYSQVDLAKKVGVTASALCQWELGYTQPGTDNLFALAKALGLPVDELVRK